MKLQCTQAVDNVIRCFSGDISKNDIMAQLRSAAPAGIVNKSVEAINSQGTRELTRTLEHALTVHQPPLVRGRRIKLRYAHQGGRNPPRIIIHGSQSASVPDSYSRYLANVFRKKFDLFATPVAMEFRSDGNPYDRPGRRKPSTPGARRSKASRRR